MKKKSYLLLLVKSIIIYLKTRLNLDMYSMVGIQEVMEQVNILLVNQLLLALDVYMLIGLLNN